MITTKIFKAYFPIFFLFVFLFYHVDAVCEKITNNVRRTDINWNFDDNFYALRGGNITLTLTDMPCGASTLLIQVVSQSGKGSYTVRTFTNKDLGVLRYIGVGVVVIKEPLFRIQARVDDLENINCPEPYFSGELCYAKYVDTPECKKEKDIEIGVPIATSIFGAIGDFGFIMGRISRRAQQLKKAREIQAQKLAAKKMMQDKKSIKL
ncbi:hypothetical protein RhiirA5_380010 [Rhizophagus irregularis]|uniref:Uncharacterized protein n=1 Tax=Rhizophagus irregularis TaxID=588596 RepID=A0A2I1F428_9GLOM|nr:hypothetical protein RhiirA5_380010 [Rhizophagus irregularis]PKY29132.1 hypothetical protein RhiirB3_391580 [Rhizophagus irregularis]